MSKLLELAERVERAEGPDRELDAMIWCALNGKRYKGHFEPYGGGAETAVEYTEPPKRTRLVTRYLHHAKPVTASIDAAMTLVPEGWWWSVGDCSASSDASVGPDVAHCDKALLIAFDDGIHADLPHPSRPALALCAVSLRARDALRARAAQEVQP